VGDNATEILFRARQREQARFHHAPLPIDYTAATAEFKQQKAALTRAVRSGDRDKVLVACHKAVVAWNQPARAWPDDWSRWQRALDDVFPLGGAPRMEDLG